MSASATSAQALKRQRTAQGAIATSSRSVDDDVLLSDLLSATSCAGRKLAARSEVGGSSSSSSTAAGKAGTRNGVRVLPDVADGPGLPRRRQQSAVSLSEVVVGYQGDVSDDPTPIRLVRRGKELVQGEVFETQSDEIKKEYPNSPIGKSCRARYNWVAETEGGRYTRDPSKMLPAVKSPGMAGKWTCDVCGKLCCEQLYVFRAFLRRDHLGPSSASSRSPRVLDPFVAYISSRCGRGLLGQLSEYARFKEEVFSLASADLSIDEVRAQLEESLQRCGREDRQFLVDELERLAGVGPGGARKTLEMETVETMLPGSSSVLLRSAEDAFRAMARALAPRVGARLLASAAVVQSRLEGSEPSTGSYLRAVADSLDAGGPLPQAPARWPLGEAVRCIELVVRAANSAIPAGDHESEDDEEKLPLGRLRVELACSWESDLKVFGPKDAASVVQLGFLQARQALHAFAGCRVSKEEASALHQKLDSLVREASLPQPLVTPAGDKPLLVRPPATRQIRPSESLGFGWHSANWGDRLKNLLGAEFDFRARPLVLVTGCSGAEAPHFALQQLVGHDGFEQLWGAEINENPRRFILRNVAMKHLFEDVCFIMEGGGRCARHGGHCAVPQGPIDIFVGGFPCTPYSFCNPKRFKRNCFTEPAAKPFFEMRKFIAERRPRFVILENVRGLLAPNPETEHPPIDFILRGKNPENKADCYQGTEPGAEWGLSFIPGYGLRWDVLYSYDWGLPQSRPRVYIIMVREDAGGQAAAEKIFDVLGACMGRLPRGSCNDFLLPDGNPQLEKGIKSWAARAQRQEATGGRRACTKFTEALFKTKRHELGLSSGDRPYSGKRDPGWFPHATEKMVQQLDIIHTMAERQGQDFEFLLADLSQQVSRGAWRDDGNAPTLTTGSSLYSFSRHRPLLGEENMWLNGFPIGQIDLSAHQEPERIFLAGNAMSVPVVGAVIFAGLVSLDWGGEGRHVVLADRELPEPIALRPDTQKLTQQSTATVMARVGPLLLDDDENGAMETLAADCEATGGQEGQPAWSRRAAVLLALARDFTANRSKNSGEAKDEKASKLSAKDEKASKSSSTALASNGLAAALQAVSSSQVGEASGDEDEAGGDGTGWVERTEKVESKKASEKELGRWLREATDLLVGMGREERLECANGLQQFVVKALDGFRDSSCQRLLDLGVDSSVSFLWNQMRFAEAKPLFARLLINDLQKQAPPWCFMFGGAAGDADEKSQAAGVRTLSSLAADSEALPAIAAEGLAARWLRAAPGSKPTVSPDWTGAQHRLRQAPTFVRSGGCAVVYIGVRALPQSAVLLPTALCLAAAAKRGFRRLRRGTARRALAEMDSGCRSNCKVMEIQGKGLGVVATETLAKGELVASEAPLLHSSGLGGAAWLEDLGSQFRALPEAKQQQVLSLADTFASDGEKSLAGIVRTNCFRCGRQAEGVVCAEVSRFNHSCLPNCEQSWDARGELMQIWTSADIRIGEELCVHYIDVRASAAERGEELQQFGFRCACPACSVVDSERDRRRSLMKGLVENTGRVGKSDPKEALEMVSQALQLYDEEGLHVQSFRKNASYYAYEMPRCKGFAV
ncbi:unnamed protein product [Polarella glacialis]|uniref:SET domain-containing protein n=1 Tax=Polarella glacialis TaxID=89957 RepID=A0A813HSC5_POLGL|nr:unnamed protein product [Polarella glacialis]